ncbi:MAG: GNAT family N-acetyltransferase [Acidobacteria bacterium]|nr:GNAT family N-acetyltransferase [Acidobacteriota bacterium]
MVMRTNELGQPIGDALPHWDAPAWPPHQAMTGRFCALRPLRVDDAAGLWEAFAEDVDGRGWTYLWQGPYERFEDFAAWVATSAASQDPQFYTLLTAADLRDVGADATRVAGVASYLRIAPAAGTIEVGHIHFAPRLQQTPAATEAMFQMMQRVFALGYRRYEWKCDALNEPSRRAAQRFGFSYEGIFRQALVYKHRNRDTAWYACIDREWPALQAAYETWLSPDNFDDQGRQRVSLATLTHPILAARG